MPRVGDKLQDRYTVQRVVADGGMARVYLAVDERFGRPVAVKAMTLKPHIEEEIEQVEGMFRREAQMLSTLDHPGLVPVYDYFIERESHFLVMAYIDGRTLQEVLDANTGFLPAAQVLGWMEELCTVSEYLHGKAPPIVFRDLKPSNVMLDPDGRVRLIDFGIAETQGHERATLFVAAGSPGYAPVEQYGGLVDARADVYSLGATAYSLLTRKVPPMAIDMLIGEAVLQHPRDLNPSLSPELERLLLKMLALYREDRYQSMTEVHHALRRLPERRPAGEAAQPVEAPVVVQRRPAYRCERCGAVKGGAADCPRCSRTAELPQPPTPAKVPVSAELRPISVGLLVVTGDGRGRELARYVETVVRSQSHPIPVHAASTDAAPLPDNLVHLTGGSVPFLAVVGWYAPGDPIALFHCADLNQDPLLAAQTMVERAATLSVSWPPTGVLTPVVNPQDGSLLLLVEAGPTLMGDRLKRHRVFVPTFYIGRHPVTNGQYRRYLEATGQAGSPKWAAYAERSGEDAPTAQVSWFEARDYAGWAGLRLPTGAEWEKAAGGGDGRKWPWGGEFLPTLCRTGVGQQTTGPVPVGSYPAGISPLGCHDMVGNVWEWCSSRFMPYPYSRANGREDPSGHEPREIRGGSWANAHVATLGISVREGIRPDRSYDYVGFRVVADVAQSETAVSRVVSSQPASIS